MARKTKIKTDNGFIVATSDQNLISNEIVQETDLQQEDISQLEKDERENQTETPDNQVVVRKNTKREPELVWKGQRIVTENNKDMFRKKHLEMPSFMQKNETETEDMQSVEQEDNQSVEHEVKTSVPVVEKKEKPIPIPIKIKNFNTQAKPIVAENEHEKLGKKNETFTSKKETVKVSDAILAKVEKAKKLKEETLAKLEQEKANKLKGSPLQQLEQAKKQKEAMLEKEEYERKQKEIMLKKVEKAKKLREETLAKMAEEKKEKLAKIRNVAKEEKIKAKQIKQETSIKKKEKAKTVKKPIARVSTAEIVYDEPEVWLPVKYGVPGMYEISNYGRVKSYANNPQGEFIKGKLHERSANIIEIKVDGKTKGFGINRLVAEHFIPNPENKTHVVHKDRNYNNNYYKNLEWMTQLESNKRDNIQYNSKLNYEYAEQIRKMIADGVPQHKVAKMFCISSMHVTRIKRGETWGKKK